MLLLWVAGDKQWAAVERLFWASKMTKQRMEAEAEEEKEMDIRQLQEGEESPLGAVLSLTAVWEERQRLVGRNKHTQDSRSGKGGGIATEGASLNLKMLRTWHDCLS